MLRWTVLFLFISLTVAQDDRSCSCMSSNLCDEDKQVHTDCPSPYEVCCGQSSAQPAVQPTSSAVAQLPTGRSTRQLQDCGVKGGRRMIGYKTIAPEEDDISGVYGEYPWMVAIMKKDRSGRQEFLCAGSIIYSNVILTSAHTVSGSAALDLTVKAGLWNNTDVAEIPKHQDRSVFRIVVHPGFVRETAANDVALLILSDHLNFTDGVAPICLPTSDTALNMSNCIATGWGSNDLYKKTVQSVLKNVTLPMVDSNACQSKMREYFGSYFQLERSAICAGGNSTDTCLGDGGGPLMCSTTADKNRFVQIGITSWGVVGCGKGYPGVYASVQVLADWIESQARSYRVDPASNRGEH